jgi:uncharacterized protein (TIGR03435 family)
MSGRHDLGLRSRTLHRGTLILLRRQNSRRNLLVFAIAAIAVAGGLPIHSQILHASGPLPSFAVASIRPSHTSQGPTVFGPARIAQPDQFELKAATVKEMITYAYGLVFDHELSGGPGWIGTEQFTIDAKPDDDEVAALSKLSRDDRETQMRLMMQSLLAQRFALKVSFETKELPVYALVVAKGGLKCPKDTSPPALADASRPRFGSSIPPPPPPPPPGYVPPTPEEARSLAQQPLHFRTRGWPFWLVVTMLSHQPELGGRPVIDKTGLDGAYDCEASWSRAGSDGPAPSFFTAIQEQMGLKLEPQKADVETVVVDSVERPSEN